jgi:hypothetical protein
MEIFFSILITFIYVICLINCGLIFLSLFRLHNKINIYVLFSSSFVLGMGIISNVWLIIGLFFLLKKIIILSVLGILLFSIFFFQKEYNEILRKIFNDLVRLLRLKFQWKITITALFIVIFLYGIGALLMPPSGDAEAFYMVWPKIIAYTQKVIPQPNYYSFSQIGISGELHYAVLINLSGVKAAKFLSWFVALSITSIIIHICSQLLITIKGKILAVVMLFTSTTFTFFITDGKVELFSAAFGLAAFLWVIEFINDDDKKLLYPAGLFLGFSMVAKFSYILIMIPAFFLLIILKSFYNDEKKLSAIIKDNIVALFFVGFFAFMGILPQFVKNYYLFNEPLAPFLFFTGNGNKWTNQGWYTPEVIKHIILTYPVAITFGKYPMQGGNLSPLLIIFFPLIFLVKRNKKVLTKEKFYIHLFIISIISVLIWVIIRPGVLAPRYIMASILIFIPPIVKNIEKYFDQYDTPTVISYIVNFSLICSLFFMLIERNTQNNNNIFLLNKIVTKHTIGLESYAYKSCNFLNQRIKDSARIYLAGYYAYYLKDSLLVSLNTEEERVKFDTCATLKSKISYLLSNGFKYLLIQKPSHANVFNVFNNSRTLQMKVYEDNQTIIYQLEKLE